MWKRVGLSLKAGCIWQRKPPASWGSHDQWAPSTGNQGRGGGGTAVTRRLVAGAHTCASWRALMTSAWGGGVNSRTRKGLLLTSTGFFSQRRASPAASRRLSRLSWKLSPARSWANSCLLPLPGSGLSAAFCWPVLPSTVTGVRQPLLQEEKKAGKALQVEGALPRTQASGRLPSRLLNPLAATWGRAEWRWSYGGGTEVRLRPQNLS